MPGLGGHDGAHSAVPGMGAQGARAGHLHRHRACGPVPYLPSTAADIAAWYVKTFGLKAKEGNSSFFVSGKGFGRIEVMKTEPNRPCHVAVQVSDFEAAVEELKAKGVEMLEPNIRPTVKAVYLKNPDPAGNTVHLLWMA